MSYILLLYIQGAVWEAGVLKGPSAVPGRPTLRTWSVGLDSNRIHILLAPHKNIHCYLLALRSMARK